MREDNSEKGEENHIRKCGRNTAGLVANQIILKQFYKHFILFFFFQGVGYEKR